MTSRSSVHRLRLIAIAAFVSLGVAGCGSGDDAAHDDDAAADPAPTTESSE